MKKFLSKVAKVFERYWRLVFYIMGTVLCFVCLFTKGETQYKLMIDYVACFVIVLIPRAFEDTLEAIRK